MKKKLYIKPPLRLYLIEYNDVIEDGKNGFDLIYIYDRIGPDKALEIAMKNVKRHPKMISETFHKPEIITIPVNVYFGGEVEREKPFFKVNNLRYVSVIRNYD